MYTQGNIREINLDIDKFIQKIHLANNSHYFKYIENSIIKPLSIFEAKT